jgi:hypothetical protein
MPVSFPGISFGILFSVLLIIARNEGIFFPPFITSFYKLWVTIFVNPSPNFVCKILFSVLLIFARNEGIFFSPFITSFYKLWFTIFVNPLAKVLVFSQLYIIESNFMQKSR